MCSDMCPCEEDAFADGGYLSLSNTDLADFGRTIYSSDGEHDDAMFFTRDNLDEWLDDQGGPGDGYSSLTKKILQYGGGDVAASDPNSWLFRIPPTVSSYRDCFFSMVENQAFEEYIEAQGTDQV